MITCHLSHLEARCQERGYTLDEVRPCIVSEDGEKITVDESHPSYPRPKPPPPPIPEQGGPGTELKALLSKIGIRSSPTCSCNKRAKTMDENGIAWCEQNVETICDWLAEESAKRKLPFLRAAGKVIIHMAIKRAKKHNSQ